MNDRDELQRLRSLMENAHTPPTQKLKQRIVNALRQKFRSPPQKLPISAQDKKGEKESPKPDVA